MSTLFIKNATIVNEGEEFVGSLVVKNGKIEDVFKGDISFSDENAAVIDATGLHLLPGMIDDQVHFREPGLTHKANIRTESRAAVAGGITSFMEMPNTKPAVLTQELLENKFQIGHKTSLANFSFFMGASNDNIEDVLKTNFKRVPGLKIFMGSSTGNMLVDNFNTLNNIFSKTEGLIAVHCEDEATIRANMVKAKLEFGENVPMSQHPIIRSHESCFKSSSLAVELAKKHSSRLHVLHISTEKELDLFVNNIDLKDKRITSEVCIHHLSFTDSDYQSKGAFIKWNPAVKTQKDQDALWKSLLNNKLDIIATDHAPHTLLEKDNAYFSCPSGAPMVQHALPMMLEHTLSNKISIEQVVEKMCHAPAICFNIEKRGFIREGYYADLVAVKPHANWKVDRSNILYSCGWSPLEDKVFNFQVLKTIVNGNVVYDNGKILNKYCGKELRFHN